jgi:hypothetical protein
MLASVIAAIVRDRQVVRRADLPALVGRRVALWEAGLPLSIRRAIVGTAAVEAEVSGQIHRVGEWWATGPAPRMGA